MKIFINTLSKFHTNPDDESMGKETWEKYSFDIGCLQEFNEGTDGYTTIGLESGTRVTVAILYNDFIDLLRPYIEYEESIYNKALFEYKEQT